MPTVMYVAKAVAALTSSEVKAGEFALSEGGALLAITATASTSGRGENCELVVVFEAVPVRAGCVTGAVLMMPPLV